MNGYHLIHRLVSVRPIGICMFVFLHLLVGSGVAYAGSNAVTSYYGEPKFLRFSNSARANGMGTCVMTMVGSESALYNPGALGIFHLHRVFSVAIPFVSEFIYDDGTHGISPDGLPVSTLKTFCIGGGVNSRLFTGPDKKFNVSLGISYSRMWYNVPTTIFEGYWPKTYISKKTSSYYTFGHGIEYYVRLGIGLNIKKLSSKLYGGEHPWPMIGDYSDLYAIDYGLLLEIPVFSIINQDFLFDQHAGNPRRLELTISYASVRVNEGNYMVGYLVTVWLRSHFPRGGISGMAPMLPSRSMKRNLRQFVLYTRKGEHGITMTKL